MAPASKSTASRSRAAKKTAASPPPAGDSATAGDAAATSSKRHRHNHGTLVRFERDDVITGEKISGVGLIVELVDGGGYGIANLPASVYVEADGVTAAS